MRETLSRLFKSKFGAAPESCDPLKGDGSGRSLFRLRGGGKSAIGALSADRKENEAFLGFSRHFRACGLPVPEIYAEALEQGAYLEEDLGDTTLFQLLTRERDGARIPASVLEVYRKAARLLPRFQLDAGKTLDYGLCYPRAAFDRQSMLWDLNHFKYYFLRLAGVSFDEQELEDDFGRLAGFLLEADRDFFLYRDFQSRNIMVRAGEPWFIDYQGGRRGALQYDVASLLYDAKADLPPAVREELLGVYLEEAGRKGVDRGRFMERFPGYVYIRILQAMGAYGLRGFHQRKSHFLQSIPYAIANLERLTRDSPLPLKLPALEEVFRRLIGSERLRRMPSVAAGLTVRIQSFSFKDGVPADDSGHGGGHVFDCRALPNPGKEARYAPLTGKDPEVAEFLARAPGVDRFLEHAFAIVEASVQEYLRRGFSYLSVSFGCTGGRHRSVYCAERLAERLRAKHPVTVELSHREQDKEAAR